MIAIIDYGMGNLRSVQKGFEKIGHQAVVTSEIIVTNFARATEPPSFAGPSRCSGGRRT